MNLILYKNQKLTQSHESEQGFSLIETVIALTTLGVCLAYAMPLFLYAKINNSKSEMRTGALIVSQRVFDDIRSKSFTTMPQTDGFNNDNLSSCSFPITPGAGRINTSNGNVIDLTNCVNATTNANPIITPNNLSSPSDSEKLQTYAMGRQYQTLVTFCQGIAATPAFGGVAAIPADPTVCTDKYRKFKVEVSYNGNKVYDLEGTYTEFQ
jgi:type II secretory pathway pseudopilin PulG